jgi:hypothetical protein
LEARLEAQSITKLGLIDKWTREIDPKATQVESFKQQKINQELWKKKTHEVQQYVARWMYTHGNSVLFQFSLLSCFSSV